MRRKLSILLAVLLLISLLSGCDDKEDTAETESWPTATAAPAEKETEAPETETAEEDEAEDPEEETEETEVEPLRTAVIRSGDEQLQAAYILLAVNPEGPFHSEELTFNDKGAEALVRWLLAEESRTKLESFGLEAYGEAVFMLPEKPTNYLGWIPDATEETKVIDLVVADTLEESGVLEELLEAFEETYGYQVQVQTTSASGTLTIAKLGIFDLVLTEKSDATDSFVAEGYARVLNGFKEEAIPLCNTEYLLCGPQDDPAGAADAQTLADAFAAIAKTESRFLSRGDDSSIHKLEKSLWPAGQEFGAWYLNVETEAGPLLVMNEFEGGYLLTDKLTWLIFHHNNGII